MKPNWVSIKELKGRGRDQQQRWELKCAHQCLTWPTLISSWLLPSALISPPAKELWPLSAWQPAQGCVGSAQAVSGFFWIGFPVLIASEGNFFRKLLLCHGFGVAWLFFFVVLCRFCLLTFFSNTASPGHVPLLSLAIDRKTSLPQMNVICFPLFLFSCGCFLGERTHFSKGTDNGLSSAWSQVGGSRRALTFLMKGHFPLPSCKVLVSLEGM